MTHHRQTQDKIEVMQAFLEDGAVLTRQLRNGASVEINPWYVSHGPTWDWYRNDYKQIDK